MSEGFYYVGDKTVPLQIEAEVDLTGFTPLEIHYEKPDGTEVQESASAIPGDSGNSVAEIIIPELDMAGEWRAQIFVDTGTTKEGLGQTITWEVFDKYATPE